MPDQSKTTGCDCLGRPLRCYNHPRDCGCTDIANATDWPKDIAERIVNEIGNYGSPVFADGANLSRVAAIIRRRLKEAANAADAQPKNIRESLGPAPSQTTALPCPFCGKPPKITKHHKEAMWRLIHSCEVVGPIMIDWRDDEASLLRSWNWRAK
jgi:hypothetical protein